MPQPVRRRPLRNAQSARGISGLVYKGRTTGSRTALARGTRMHKKLALLTKHWPLPPPSVLKGVPIFVRKLAAELAARGFKPHAVEHHVRRGARHGFIDLVARHTVDRDRFAVIELKTLKAPLARVTAKPRRYRERMQKALAQARLYAQALRRQLGTGARVHAWSAFCFMDRAHTELVLYQDVLTPVPP